MSFSHQPAKGFFARGLRLSFLEVMIVAGAVLVAGLTGVAASGLLPV